MNDAIAAAKEAQKKVRVMTMDQREQIISNIRRKTHENAEVLARMAWKRPEWETWEIKF